tara:strand:+ start:1318 stop:1533 length:216 start_codon:yes stop_codon:yes gene_type:complete
VSIESNFVCADPCGDLLIDTDNGEGHVRLPRSFYDHNDVLQLDVLGDWIMALEGLAAEIYAEAYPGSQGEQ